MAKWAPPRDMVEDRDRLSYCLAGAALTRCWVEGKIGTDMFFFSSKGNVIGVAMLSGSRMPGRRRVFFCGRTFSTVARRSIGITLLVYNP